MDRNLLITELQKACDYEEKFMAEFDPFLTTHVLENYHLSDEEKEFVHKRVKILFDDSKRHLNTFNSILFEIDASPDLLL